MTTSTQVRKLSSDAIIGPFKRTWKHSHRPDVGPVPDPHEHEVEVKLTFRSDEESGTTFILNQPTQVVLDETLDGFFDQDFTDTTVEEAAESLFGRIEETMPRLKDTFNQHAFHLHTVSIAIDYNGSLDHPTQRIEFVRSLG